MSSGVGPPEGEAYERGTVLAPQPSFFQSTDSVHVRDAPEPDGRFNGSDPGVVSSHQPQGLPHATPDIPVNLNTLEAGGAKAVVGGIMPEVSPKGAPCKAGHKCTDSFFEEDGITQEKRLDPWATNFCKVSWRFYHSAARPREREVK